MILQSPQSHLVGPWATNVYKRTVSCSNLVVQTYSAVEDRSYYDLPTPSLFPCSRQKSLVGIVYPPPPGPVATREHVFTPISNPQSPVIGSPFKPY